MIQMQMLGLQTDSNFLDVKCADGQVATEFAGGFYGLQLARTKTKIDSLRDTPTSPSEGSLLYGYVENVGKPKTNWKT